MELGSQPTVLALYNPGADLRAWRGYSWLSIRCGLWKGSTMPAYRTCYVLLDSPCLLSTVLLPVSQEQAQLSFTKVVTEGQKDEAAWLTEALCGEAGSSRDDTRYFDTSSLQVHFG